MAAFDLKDRKLFGNEAGEDEDINLLNSYYIDHEDFDDFFDKEIPLSIVSARKGMGKSALLSRLQYKLQNESGYSSPIVIRVKGNDLLGLGDFTGKDQAFLENYWKQIICKKIILEVGNRIGFALSSDEMSIVEISELDGHKSKNIIGGLVSRVVGKIPFLNSTLKSSIPENLVSLLNNYQQDNLESTVWMLIDDIDAKYQNTPEYQARVGSFFSAIRWLAVELSGLNVRATVRRDVWSCLRHLEDLDKLEQYIIDIFWAKRHMRDMLASRVLAYVKRKSPNSVEAKYVVKRDYNKIFDLVFQSPVAWRGDNNATLFEAISTFSNRRPRWMGQLCRMAGVKAGKISTARKISLDHINYILEEFGRNRRDDLIKEHRHQFEELENLIDAFRATEREFKYSQINTVIEEKFVRGRQQSEVPHVDGSRYVKPEDLGDFIYRLGLISRIHDDGKTFTHYTDDPDLYFSGENRSDNINWSIHPSYRTFLNIR